ncbi:Dihydroorotate dehydrogenase-domain-containing protein [Naematelia encephala]|uniref:Dihydroorotate dehydrogenase (quinone), mitochondrial n=1 Tax=Naematelia encephala TaxID=71784 RepID=A0A1Y2BLD9_9TREE|nr:Dihydroorotate dehydrogenase-domain-containing protein [Naematelia encephala]
MARRIPAISSLRLISLRPSSTTFATPRRHASTSRSAPRRFLSTTLLLGTTGLFLAYYYDSQSLFHEHVAMPLIRMAADPETGHKMAVRMLSLPRWARPRDMGVDGDELGTEVFGMRLKNPVGIAAGFDKDGEAIDGLFDLGFGYVEIGSVTPEPQPGNPKPRFFRLEEDGAAINRYGFNSLGHGQTLGQLRARLVHFSRSHPSLFPSPLPSSPLPPSSLPRSLRPGQLLAVNLGKNKTSPADSNEDYIRGVRTLGPYADVVVINVSSPNTPGLRALQGRETLEKLLKEVVQERNKQGQLPKIAVKVTCDLSEEELGDVASAVRQSGVDGVIVSNTTVRREGLGLESSKQTEIGGLSGRPLFPLALNALKTLRPLLPPSISVIGAGGVTTGSDALNMARAGASVVQIYTSFGYRGVGAPRLLKDEISTELKGSSWSSEIGKDWSDGGMGWDEERLKRDSEAIRREAQGLSDLLRELNETRDMERLVQEAERALSGSPRDNETTGPVQAQETEKQDQVVVNLLEAAGEQQQQGADVPLIEQPVAQVEVQQIGSNELDPIVVRAIPGEVEEEEDPFTREVRSGQRRLV